MLFGDMLKEETDESCAIPGKLEMNSWGSVGAILVGVDWHVEKKSDVHEPTVLCMFNVS